MALHIDRNLGLANEVARWAEANAPEPSHDERTAFAAQFIPAGARVLDLGCGRMALRQYLPNGCGYQGCDFRSMLIDIFGRSYPEKEFFLVDRDAVTRYKARVHRNVTRVGERIEVMLRNVAVAAG